MPSEKTLKDFKQITEFMEHYPFPEYPKKSTSNEQAFMDEEYFQAMRSHGIEPNHVTSMEFNKLMVKRLMETAFPA